MRKRKLFNIIKNKQEYWLVDQIKHDNQQASAYMEDFKKLLHEWEKEKAGFISVLMDPALEENMTNLGFSKISTIAEYTRGLENAEFHDEGLLAHALAEGNWSDYEFSRLYDQCRSGSANKNKEQTMDQVMNTLSNELGTNWRSNCFIFTNNQSVIGIAIPHIEMGTKDEGRLFYFGVVPEFRSKGLGKRMHRKTLELLKEMQAAYYVGSTDTANTAMIEIFKQNGCELRDHKGIYRKETI